MAKGVNKESLFGGLTPTDKPNVYVDTHTHDDADVVKPKNIKNKRIQILTYSNLVRRMDAYAKRNGLSRAEVFEMAVGEFLDNHI